MMPHAMRIERRAMRPRAHGSSFSQKTAAKEKPPSLTGCGGACVAEALAQLLITICAELESGRVTLANG
jgi:hypothetical protein